MKHKVFLQKVAQKLPQEAVTTGLPKPEIAKRLEEAVTEVLMDQKPQPRRSQAKAWAHKKWGRLFTKQCLQIAGGLFVFVITRSIK